MVGMVNQILEQGLREMGLAEEKAEQLAIYGQLLLEKNKVMNLTAIRDPESVARLHMLDSAALLTFIDLKQKTVIDVGTGAGFPGLVLKILEPTIQLTLLDSQEKRLLWLDEVCQQLQIQQVSLIHARAEEQSHLPAFREQFDVAVSRAVAAMPILTEFCLPYVKVGGFFFALKSAESDEEILQADAAVQILGGSILRAYTYSIPDTEIQHRIIPVQKMEITPVHYPRRWAKIQKSPLSRL